jgi:hypothetical protein
LKKGGAAGLTICGQLEQHRTLGRNGPAAPVPLTAVGLKEISRLLDVALARNRSHGLQTQHRQAGARSPTGSIGELERQARGSRLGRKIEAQITACEPLASGGILQLHRSQQGEGLQLGVSFQAIGPELLRRAAGR